MVAVDSKVRARLEAATEVSHGTPLGDPTVPGAGPALPAELATNTPASEAPRNATSTAPMTCESAAPME